MKHFKKRAIIVLLLVAISTVTRAASFELYFSKLVRFEGKGYGINQAIWGNKIFTKAEAFRIHKHFYWNKYHGDLFKSQGVAEALIDHIINAGEGKESVNIRAFEAIIGVEQDGDLSKKDVKAANAFIDSELIVNPYVNYRLHYYSLRKNYKKYPGWIRRAKSFLMLEKDNTKIGDYLVLPDIMMKPNPSLTGEEVAIAKAG